MTRLNESGEMRVKRLGGDGRLEVEALLGDRVLDVLLYQRILLMQVLCADAGTLTMLRSRLASNATLAAVARQFVVPKFVSEHMFETLDTHERGTVLEAFIGRAFMLCQTLDSQDLYRCVEKVLDAIVWHDTVAGDKRTHQQRLQQHSQLKMTSHIRTVTKTVSKTHPFARKSRLGSTSKAVSATISKTVSATNRRNPVMDKSEIGSESSRIQTSSLPSSRVTSTNENLNPTSINQSVAVCATEDAKTARLSPNSWLKDLFLKNLKVAMDGKHLEKEVPSINGSLLMLFLALKYENVSPRPYTVTFTFKKRRWNCRLQCQGESKIFSSKWFYKTKVDALAYVARLVFEHFKVEKPECFAINETLKTLTKTVRKSLRAGIAVSIDALRPPMQKRPRSSTRKRSLSKRVDANPVPLKKTRSSPRLAMLRGCNSVMEPVKMASIDKDIRGYGPDESSKPSPSNAKVTSMKPSRFDVDSSSVVVFSSVEAKVKPSPSPEESITITGSSRVMSSSQLLVSGDYSNEVEAVAMVMAGHEEVSTKRDFITITKDEAAESIVMESMAEKVVEDVMETMASDGYGDGSGDGDGNRAMDIVDEPCVLDENKKTKVIEEVVSRPATVKKSVKKSKKSKVTSVPVRRSSRIAARMGRH